MGTVNIGVVGLGRMGKVYAYHVGRQMEGASLVAIADPRADIRESFTAQFGGIAAYTDHHELLSHPDLHGVIIATPTSTHRDVVIAAAEAGKAIFCEKPTALTLEATDEMIAAIQRAGVMFQVGFMRRFDTAYAEAKRKIDDGVIGQPATIRSISRDPHRTSLEYANPDVSGGIIVDMGIHDVDVVRWLMNDDVDRVYTEAASLVYPELLDVRDVDSAMISLKFTRGGLGNIEVSRTAIYGYDIQAEVIGSTGTIHIGYLRHTPILVMKKDGVHHDVVPHFPERFGEAYTRQVEHFVECLQHDKTPIITVQDARAALQVSIAATISQNEGRVVYVQDVQASS